MRKKSTPTARQLALRERMMTFEQAIAQVKDQQQLTMENGVFAAMVMADSGWSATIVPDDVTEWKVVSTGPLKAFVPGDDVSPDSPCEATVRTVRLERFALANTVTCGLDVAVRLWEWLGVSRLDPVVEVGKKPSLAEVRVRLKVFGYDSKRMPISQARRLERRLRRVTVRWSVTLPVGIDVESKTVFVPERFGWARPYLIGEAVRLRVGEAGWTAMKAMRHAAARARRATAAG